MASRSSPRPGLLTRQGVAGYEKVGFGTAGFGEPLFTFSLLREFFFLRATEIFGSFATRMFHFCARLQFREACAPRPTRLHRRLQGRTNWSWTGYSVGRF